MQLKVIFARQVLYTRPRSFWGRNGKTICNTDCPTEFDFLLS